MRVVPSHTTAVASGCAQSTVINSSSTVTDPDSPKEIADLLPHRVFAGNQPSSTMLLSSLNPGSLGSLVALYEHKVFVQGAVWGINSFDQWGVELGKAVANRILPAVYEPELAKMLDASTQGLLNFSRKHLK